MYRNDYISHVLEWIKVKQIQSERTRGIFEMIGAALWLIGGFQFAQSLVMFCNIIELILKAELELYHSTLIIDQKPKLTDLEIQEIAKKGKGHTNENSLLVSERTISLREAIRRIGLIDQYKVLILQWKDKLQYLIEKRNDIVHNGYKSDTKYSADIVSIAIPFLSEFFAISNNISLKGLIAHDVYREIEAAQLIDSKLKEENIPSSDYILKTVAYKMLYTFNHPNQSLDDYDREIEEERFLANRMESQLWSDWADGDWVEESCQICDSIRTFVKVKPYIRPSQGLIPIAVRCPKCALEINEDEKYLAQFHVSLQKEVIEDYFENKFFLEDYKDSDLDRD